MDGTIDLINGFLGYVVGLVAVMDMSLTQSNKSQADGRKRERVEETVSLLKEISGL